jgi:N-acetylglucosaminyldiphosphoundecaprenol N-acetyl-beta-D-mannosaminyltransferase
MTKIHSVCPRVNILGVGVSVTNLHEAASTILEWVEQGERHYVCVTGIHGIMECQKDAALLSIHNESGLTVPDGMPTVWLGKIYGFQTIGRVYGPDLMTQVCSRSIEREHTHFLYGGNVGVAQTLKENLGRWFHGIRIVGTYTPPFEPLSETEEEILLEHVQWANPDFFWVGLSTPKQERFMAEYLSRLETKVMVGVGAAFDILAGNTRDAPPWIKKIGMQWLHRLYQEPRRLWRRYLHNNPVFVYKAIKQIIHDKT